MEIVIYTANDGFGQSDSLGTKLKDRHALMGAVMRPALKRDLRYAGALDAELFAQQGALFLEPVGLRSESCQRIDAIGSPGTRDMYNDRMNVPQKRELGPQRLGKWMITAAWLLLLALLTWFFNSQLNRQRNPNRQVLTATSTAGLPEVQLKRNRFGHYVASGLINGQPAEFMLDTGATDVSIPLPIAERLRLEKGQPLVYQTANGAIRAWQTLLDEIRLGDLRVGPVRASINPGFSGEDILLGMSFLKQLDFSQQGDTLTLKQRSGD